MKAYIETSKINNLYAYLKKTDKNEILIRTTYVSGVDIDIDAHCAGFKMYRTIRTDLVPAGQFAEFFHFVRKQVKN